jgi:hypothetical protein
MSELKAQKLIKEQRTLGGCALLLGNCSYFFFQSGKPIKERSSLLRE